MDRAAYDDYVHRFNSRDATAFDDYLAPEVSVRNGGLHYRGVRAMKEHYASIWRTMRETLSILRFVASEDTLAVEMHTHFDVERDDPLSVFGPVRAGEAFDYRGVVMYRLANGRFTDIAVAYLSFERTGTDGICRALGIPH